MKKVMGWILFIVAMGFCLLMPGVMIADQKAPPSGATGRTNSISFEDEIIEGMNKNPFDSVTHMSKKDDRSQRRLYKRKENFRYEMKLTIREMGLVQ